MSIDSGPRRPGSPPGRRTLTPRPTRRVSVESLVVVAAVGVGVSLLADGAILFLLTSAVIYVLFALSVNVLFGWTGMASFGQAAYFGAGAYTVGLLRETAVPAPVNLALATLVGLLFAVVFGIVAVRTTGVEFAMLTLVFAQALWLLTFRIPALRGEDGLPGVPRGELLGIALGPQRTFWWYTVAVVGLCAVVLRRLQRSSLGAAFSAVRDDPLRAAALGVRVRVVRVTAFGVAGMFGATAGGLFAQQQGLVSPSTLFWALSGNVIVMCLIGGLHHFWGPAIGAVVFTLFNWLLFEHTAAPRLYIGLCFLLVVILLPGGLASVPRVAWDRCRQRHSGSAA